MPDTLKAAWLGLSRRVKISLGLACLALLFGVPAALLLPEAGLRWGLAQTMHRFGMAEVTIADTSVELLDGRLVISSFRAKPKIGEALGLKSLDFAFRWLPLLRREMSVQSLDLSGLSISLLKDGGKILVNGAPVDLGAGGEDGSWSVNVDHLKLASSRIDLVDGERKIAIDVDSLELNALRSASPDAPLNFHFRGKVEGNPLEVAGTATPFAATPRFDLTLSADAVDLALFAPWLAGAGFDALTGQLAANLTVSGTGLSSVSEIKANGKLSFRDITAQASGHSFEAKGMEIAADQLSWNGSTRRVGWQGVLSLENVAATGAGLAARSQALSWLGLADLEMGSDGAAIASMTMAIDGNGLSLRDPVAKADILLAERFEAKSAKLVRAQFAADGGMQADGLTFDDLTLKMIRPTNPGSGEKGPAKAAESLKQADAAMAPTQRIRLGRFAIAGDSRLDFIDNTLKQPVGITFDRVKLSLANLDSSEPGHESPFELEARVGAALISVHGTSKPFATGISAKFSSQVRAFELPPLSPYASETLGVELQTGHLDGELTVALENGALSGKADLALSNLFAAQPDPNAPVAKHASMPVSMVLDLLRDGDDRIRLSIPVSGNLSDPQFDFSDAMSQAIGGALRSTALTTLKIVFPVAVLIEKMTDQQAPLLAPITFSPGDAQMDDQGQARLAMVGELMKGRPKLKLSLCPVSSPGADWPVLLERRKREELGLLYSVQKMVNAEAKPDKMPPDALALKALAERRAIEVKTELMNRAGVEAGRLFACLPQIDAAPDAAPRVDLTL
ncbi:conserved exported hypothetical protein [Rhodospirillaceae bacterium LM-1]|nr:conserved exported hypothetical protein [Rhodospirillaceae bacterium LM-1]